LARSQSLQRITDHHERGLIHGFNIHRLRFSLALGPGFLGAVKSSKIRRC
jgi:hypothetical protein